jgi:1,4-alpha-glucan branching enzyme
LESSLRGIIPQPHDGESARSVTKQAKARETAQVNGTGLSVATTSGKKEVFRVVIPEAQRVLLVGDFTNWQARPIGMLKGTDGSWTATVILPRGRHQYLFIVDETWREDPNCSERVANSTGGFNMVRVVNW